MSQYSFFSLGYPDPLNQCVAGTTGACAICDVTAATTATTGTVRRHLHHHRSIGWETCVATRYHRHQHATGVTQCRCRTSHRQLSRFAPAPPLTPLAELPPPTTVSRAQQPGTHVRPEASPPPPPLPRWFDVAAYPLRRHHRHHRRIACTVLL